MDSQKKIPVVSHGPVVNSTGLVKLGKTNSSASPRKQQGPVKNEAATTVAAITGRPVSATKPEDEIKKIVTTMTSCDEDDFGKKPSRAADGRYGSRGGGDSLLRIPLECMSRLEIKEELRKSQILLPGNAYASDDEGDEDENGIKEAKEDEVDTALDSDRARFNVWKGQNYDLHMLGDFKSDFDRRVKSFQKPDMEDILMDPFCRDESGLLEEPPNGKAFLVWKSKSDRWDPKKALKESGSESRYPVLVTSSSSSGDDEEDSDTDSLPDPIMTEYISSQKQRKVDGESLTGESIYFDEEFGVLRNLHRESHSLTSYGGPPDERFIGKAHIFYPEMTEDEKNMLRPRPEVEKPSVATKKKSQTTIATRSPRKKPLPKDKGNSDNTTGQKSDKKLNITDSSAGDGVTAK